MKISFRLFFKVMNNIIAIILIKKKISIINFNSNYNLLKKI